MCVFGSLQGCEREVAESGNAESKNESLMRLSWALVHSRHPEDVNRGIAMLEGVYTSYGQLYFLPDFAASLDNSASPLQSREKLYLLAVGYYRNGDYPRSRQLLDRCLETKTLPIFHRYLSQQLVGIISHPSQILKESLLATDGVIGIGIAATAVGLLVGGIAAVVARKK
ncbi:unnamed protein product [Musa hybrid cultivar]